MEMLHDENDTKERTEFNSGAVREPAKGKGRFDLMSPFALERIAKRYEFGSQKYCDRNWEKGMPFSRYIDSALRHINQYVKGYQDEDHLAAACFNLMAIMHHEETNTGTDDMPHYQINETTDDMEKDFKSFIPYTKKNTIDLSMVTNTISTKPSSTNIDRSDLI